MLKFNDKLGTYMVFQDTIFNLSINKCDRFKEFRLVSIYTFRFEHYFIEQMEQKYQKCMTKGGGWDPLPPLWIRT